MLEKKIFCFWTGDNEMPSNRKKALDSMKDTGVDIVLITPNNLSQYILKESPLHECYSNLNPVHRSDYLRPYFMHHYGGGYSDIKFITGSWIEAFNKLDVSDKVGLGYREIGPNGVALVGGNLYKELVSNWSKLIGCGAFIFKANTEFTKEWINNVNKLMDNTCNKLKNRQYPFEYTSIMGHIFHPLCLKYSDKLIQDNSVKPDFSKAYQ